ncbi:hypothetical protein N8013_04095 [Algibacter sp.]|nr:hypothetical protein [Algibacter sp.]MDC1277009.1 hypothetical protein [Algibacter sp.]
MSKMKVMIPCDEANLVCDKTQYKEATLLEKIKLNIHLIYCKVCRKYSKNNKTLSKTIKKSNIECLDKTCKDTMKKDFEKVLKEVSN